MENQKQQITVTSPTILSGRLTVANNSTTKAAKTAIIIAVSLAITLLCVFSFLTLSQLENDHVKTEHMQSNNNNDSNNHIILSLNLS